MGWQAQPLAGSPTQIQQKGAYVKRQIEIEDTLHERVEIAIEEVEDRLRSYLNDNPDIDECPCLNNDLDYDGSIHEIIDAAVPLYNYEIKATWYLHDTELEQAYEGSGIGNNPRENNGMIAIYCYIEQKVSEWYHENAKGVFIESKQLSALPKSKQR